MLARQKQGREASNKIASNVIDAFLVNEGLPLEDALPDLLFGLVLLGEHRITGNRKRAEAEFEDISEWYGYRVSHRPRCWDAVELAMYDLSSRRLQIRPRDFLRFVLEERPLRKDDLLKVALAMKTDAVCLRSSVAKAIPETSLKLTGKADTDEAAMAFMVFGIRAERKAPPCTFLISDDISPSDLFERVERLPEGARMAFVKTDDLSDSPMRYEDRKRLESMVHIEALVDDVVVCLKGAPGPTLIIQSNTEDLPKDASSLESMMEGSHSGTVESLGSCWNNLYNLPGKTNGIMWKRVKDDVWIKRGDGDCPGSGKRVVAVGRLRPDGKSNRGARSTDSGFSKATLSFAVKQGMANEKRMDGYVPSLRRMYALQVMEEVDSGVPFDEALRKVTEKAVGNRPPKRGETSERCPPRAAVRTSY